MSRPFLDPAVLRRASTAARLAVALALTFAIAALLAGGAAAATAAPAPCATAAAPLQADAGDAGDADRRDATLRESASETSVLRQKTPRSHAKSDASALPALVPSRPGTPPALPPPAAELWLAPVEAWRHLPPTGPPAA